MENRVEKAVGLFKEGYNCSQSVFVAYADVFNLDKDTALKLSCSFGGGIGGMREVCGAVSGMTMLAGLYNGTNKPKDKEGKKVNYDTVQLLANEFKAENGSIICKELLALVPGLPEDKKKETLRRVCAPMRRTGRKTSFKFLIKKREKNGILSDFSLDIQAFSLFYSLL